MKILITGVAGLLGSNFSRFLLQKGYSVSGVDNFSGGYKEFLPVHKKFSFYKRDLQEDSLDNIFKKEKPNAVFHFAAYAAEGLSPFIRSFNYKNNLIASVNVINQCVKHECKLIFTSSMAVYGAGKTPFTEKTPRTPIDPYGIAKTTVEQDIKQAHNQFGLQYTIVRPHNVVGVYQNVWDKYRNVIGIFIRRALNKEPILIYGDGTQTRAFSDVAFYMSPFEKLIDNFNDETFNIGADKFYSINHVAEMVQAVSQRYGIEAKIEHKEKREEVKHAFCDHKKAKKLLHFKDDTCLENLIIKMFEWVKSEPNRKVKKMKYEIEKGIYSYWK